MGGTSLPRSAPIWLPASRSKSLGTPIDDYVRLRIPKPVKTAQGWHTSIIHVDHFGNLATNLEKDMLLSQSVDIWINSQRVSRVVQTYSEAKAGELVAMFDSSNHLSICVVNSSAAEMLRASAGDAVEIIYRKKTGQLSRDIPLNRDRTISSALPHHKQTSAS